MRAKRFFMQKNTHLLVFVNIKNKCRFGYESDTQTMEINDGAEDGTILLLSLFAKQMLIICAKNEYP
jgi:hypothetical protein